MPRILARRIQIKMLMMDPQQLLQRLASNEDNLIERKPDNDPREWRKTIVAFANSLFENQTAYLFIGIGDGGETAGVANSDKVQKQVGDICDNKCYPPIRPRPRCVVLQVGGKDIVAVEVNPSNNRPHFSGPAYVRSGSRSVVASEEMFQELIDSRHDKTRVLLEWKRRHGTPVKVVAAGKRMGDSKPLFDPHYSESSECTIEECNAHFVTFRTTAPPTRTFSEPLAGIEISGRTPDGALLLTVKPT